jgi:hypothetical protein
MTGEPFDFDAWMAGFDQWIADRHRQEEAAAVAEAERLAAAERATQPEAAVALQLPGGHVWRLRPTLTPEAGAAHLERLRTDGATFPVWHRFFQAVDLGWTLPYPSPADMTDEQDWAAVDRPTAEAIGDWLARTVADVLSDRQPAAA